MAKLSHEDILKLATLSRLDLSEEEISRFNGELNAILNYVELLNEVDVTGLKPTSQVTGLENVTRADEILDYGYGQAELLKNAPAQKDALLKVHRMIG